MRRGSADGGSQDSHYWFRTADDRGQTGPKAPKSDRLWASDRCRTSLRIFDRVEAHILNTARDRPEPLTLGELILCFAPETENRWRLFKIRRTRASCRGQLAYAPRCPTVVATAGRLAWERACIFPSHQPALLHRRGDEALEQRMRVERARFQLGVELHANEPGVVGILDGLRQQTVRRHAREHQPRRLEPLAVCG